MINELTNHKRTSRQNYSLSYQVLRFGKIFLLKIKIFLKFLNDLQRYKPRRIIYTILLIIFAH